MADLLVLRNSERATFKSCRQQWFWGYQKRLKSNTTGTALTFGTMAHSAMELWYPPGTKRGVHPAETFARLYEESGDDFNQWDDEGNAVDALTLGTTMMNGYVENYGQDPLIEIIHPEMAFQVDVYDKEGRYLVTLVGRFDAVGINLRVERTFVFEHKTGKRLEQVAINSRYGEQGLSYWWAANLILRHKGLLEEGQWVDSVMYNWLLKKMPDERPVNANGLRLNKPKKDDLVAKCDELGIDIPRGYKNIDGLTELLTEAGIDVVQMGEPSSRQPGPRYSRQEMLLDDGALRQFEKRLRRETQEILWARERKLSIYKNPGDACKWCQFRDVCEVHEMDGDWRSMFELDFHVWDPYSDHELALEAV